MEKFNEVEMLERLFDLEAVQAIASDQYDRAIDKSTDKGYEAAYARYRAALIATHQVRTVIQEAKLSDFKEAKSADREAWKIYGKTVRTAFSKYNTTRDEAYRKYQLSHMAALKARRIFDQNLMVETKAQRVKDRAAAAIASAVRLKLKREGINQRAAEKMAKRQQ